MKFLLVIVAAALAALTSGSALRVNRALAHEEQEVLDAESWTGDKPKERTCPKDVEAGKPCSAGAADCFDGHRGLVCSGQSMWCLGTKLNWEYAEMVKHASIMGIDKKACT